MNQTRISNKNDPLRFLKPRRRDLSTTPQKQPKNNQKLEESPKPIIQNLQMKGARLFKQYNPNKYFSSKCIDYLKSINYGKTQTKLEESIIHEIKTEPENNYETFSKKTVNKMAQQIIAEPKRLFEPQIAGEQNAQLKECNSCGRKFILASYQRHIRICDSVFNKKRKPFSSQKQRSQSKGKQKATK